MNINIGSFLFSSCRLFSDLMAVTDDWKCSGNTICSTQTVDKTGQYKRY